MEINNLEGRSRGSSFRRRALTLVGASALTLSGVGAAVFGASQAFATTNTTNPTSSSYSIGTGAISSLAVSSSNNTASTANTTVNAVYTITFVATDGIAASGTINYSFTDATVGSSVTASVEDTTTGKIQQITTVTSSAVTVPNAIPSGHGVKLVLNGVAQGTTVTTNATATVSTSADTAPVTSSGYAITAPTAAAKTLTTTASPTSQSSTSATWTLGAFELYSGSTVTSLPAGSTITLAIPGASFVTTASAYSLTDTPSSGSASTVTFSSATPSGNGTSNAAVALVTKQAISTGDTLSLSATNAVTNPVVTTATPTAPTLAATSIIATDYYNAETPGSTTAVTSLTATAVTFASVTIGGSATSVTSASLSVSPASASTASSTNYSTYTAQFTILTPMINTDSVTVQLASGTTISTSNTAIITDVTSGATKSLAITSGDLSASSNSNTNNQVTLVPGFVTAKNDVVTVELFGVQNPQTVGALTGEVFTLQDTTPVGVSYSLVAPTTVSTQITVSPSDTTVGQYSTYTITNLSASSAIPAGNTFSLGDNASGTATTYPLSASDYQITDLTNSSASGTATKVISDTGIYGVTVTVPNAIAANDNLTVTISDVINPINGSSYNMQFVGLQAATAAVAPVVTTAPSAASTMASGSLVQNGGTIYVVSGGVAFGIPTYSDFVSISNGLGNPAVVQVTTGPSTVGTLASGTLVQVVGSPEVMVVGSNNTAYGFSTPSQLTSDGYSFANVIQIPSLGNLTAGSGVAPSTASTMASGSLVQNGGTIYVIAGGVAFGIPTYSDFTTISAELGNPAVVQLSTVPTTTGTMASGTLVQHVGSFQINVVTTTGVQVGFSTASQFLSGGYSPSKVVMIP